MVYDTGSFLVRVMPVPLFTIHRGNDGSLYNYGFHHSIVLYINNEIFEDHFATDLSSLTREIDGAVFQKMEAFAFNSFSLYCKKNVWSKIT